MTKNTQIPVIAEKPLLSCGSRKFQLDAMGDYLFFTSSGVQLTQSTHDTQY
jgi:hypothetical protein